jgi:hypothetical protein
VERKSTLLGAKSRMMLGKHCVRTGFMIDTMFCWIRTRICHNTIVLNNMNMIDLALFGENRDLNEYYVTLLNGWFLAKIWSLGRMTSHNILTRTNRNAAGKWDRANHWYRLWKFSMFESKEIDVFPARRRPRRRPFCIFIAALISILIIISGPLAISGSCASRTMDYRGMIP